jgi:hypothetical protein
MGVSPMHPAHSARIGTAIPIDIIDTHRSGPDGCPQCRAIGSPDINYLTGRYAMPIAILMFAAVYNRRILTLRPRALRLFFAFAAVASLAGMIISVARRYYG